MGGAVAFLLIMGLYAGGALGLYFGLRKFKII